MLHTVKYYLLSILLSFSWLKIDTDECQSIPAGPIHMSIQYSNHHLTSHTCLHKPLLKTLEILVGSPGSYFLTAEGEAEEAEEAGLLYLCL